MAPLSPATAPATAALSQAQFVAWLRAVAPYVHSHRGRTFVVAFEGELIEAGHLNSLAHDLSLLHAMGIRLVLVHGSRPQVQAQLQLKGLQTSFFRGLRITDAAALACVKEAAGGIRLDIEAAFSQGLPSTPMANSKIRVVGGNFVVARPVGIVDGVDFQHTGVVRKIDTEAIERTLRSESLVLMSPLGFSPTGEAFNLKVEDVATCAAIALKADKLILIGSQDGVHSASGKLLSELSLEEAERMLATREASEPALSDLEHMVRACRGGVARAHLIPLRLDGGLLIELFTHAGLGTLVSAEHLEALREATSDDVGGILKLIEPLEVDGTLVKRARELIEREIGQFSVFEHDGFIQGCAALYPFEDAAMGELACLTVHGDYREGGLGERLMKRIETRARAAGLNRLFVLTTRTSHWFLKRGFAMAKVEDLPVQRQRMYNWQRRSQVLIKGL
ncbi:MAG TPA: amino-acid N-acetyltransferase [Burkholderiaceae bacterium]|nr:amino-acid N-acetyltransferase [Burkholderiaceae bacterium]